MTFEKLKPKYDDTRVTDPQGRSDIYIKSLFKRRII